MALTNMKIRGMHCQTCVKKIQEGLKKLDGVKKVSIDLTNDSSKITYNPKKISIDTIKDEIKNLGYNKENNFFQGILFGIIPHTGCILFIIASIIGATFFTNLFRPLLMNRFFFWFLICLSFIFATLSSGIYLHKNKLLTKKGVQKKWKYLSTMYLSTASINVLLFLVVFPMTANLTSADFVDLGSNYLSARIKVDIPCSGHAPLIIDELNKDLRIENVKYVFPNYFTFNYVQSVQDVSLFFDTPVFREYPATIVS